jgi:protein tyrosine phosphatase (PTP) superfamily phosphohydrolase (DUF442 family)
MGILKEPKLATKQPKITASQRCDACDVDAHHVPVEAASVESLQVVRCVDPVACRMRAQSAGTWALV